jgi:segregation and condensation protein A
MLSEVPLEQVTLFRLLRVFERLIERMEEGKKAKRVHTVYNFNYTIQEQRTHLMGLVQGGGKISFDEAFLSLENRIHAIVTFLALLELLNAQEIALVQGEGFNNFWLELPTEQPEV